MQIQQIKLNNSESYLIFDSHRTRNGNLVQTATLGGDGKTLCKVIWGNRTWESEPYITLLNKAMDKLTKAGNKVELI